MYTITKKLFTNGGSQCIVLPAEWLSKFGDVKEVLLVVDDSGIIIRAVPNK